MPKLKKIKQKIKVLYKYLRMLLRLSDLYKSYLITGIKDNNPEKKIKSDP